MKFYLKDNPSKIMFQCRSDVYKNIIILFGHKFKIIDLKNHPSISYDILSINTGSISNNNI